MLQAVATTLPCPTLKTKDVPMSTIAKAVCLLALLGVIAVAVWLARPLFVDTVVDEGFPLSAGAVVPDDMSAEEVEQEMADAAAAPVTAEAEPMPAGAPVAVVSGTVVGVDDAHLGSGTATVYDVDGSRVLRLEDFEVTNGPDLHVYLAPIGADGAPDVDAGVDLGSLRGNIGDQNYDVPADVDLTQPLAVVIWCQPFRVTFATAPLA